VDFERCRINFILYLLQILWVEFAFIVSSKRIIVNFRGSRGFGSPGSVYSNTPRHWITARQLISDLYERSRFSLLKLINPQKEVFVFHFGGLSLANDVFALNSIVNRMIALSLFNLRRHI
jgi:hypothetical protein